MKTDPPPVRNPDPQLAAADIDTSRLDADTNNFGPRLGLAWSPLGRHVRGARRLRPVLRPHAVDHARHRALEQRRQHRLADLHRRRGADVSAEVRRPSRPAARRRGRSSSTSITTSPTPALMQANAAIEWQVAGPDHGDRHLSVRGRRSAVALDRSQHRHDWLASPSRWRASSTTYPYPFFAADRPFANFQRVIAFESTAVSRYNGLTLELNRRFCGRPAVPRRLHARQGRGHGARRDRRRSRQRRRRREVRVEPGRLRRRQDRRATTTSVIASWPAACTAPTAGRPATKACRAR